MKNPIFIISTFDSIDIPENKKPIVICDIDLTFIRPSRDYDDLYQEIKNDHSDFDPIELDLLIRDMLRMSINIGMVKQTDEEGFLKLLNKVNEKKGKFLFLTARSGFAHEKTINDLKTVGLQNPEEFEIHYTGNQITKGQYIQRFNLLQGYDHAIFIDDFPHFLESALQIYPTMNCYLFKCK
jgi:predicted secreted acid phosphatase